jgi:hypothetical protein
MIHELYVRYVVHIYGASARLQRSIATSKGAAKKLLPTGTWAFGAIRPPWDNLTALVASMLLV